MGVVTLEPFSVRECCHCGSHSSSSSSGGGTRCYFRWAVDKDCDTGQTTAVTYVDSACGNTFGRPVGQWQYVGATGPICHYQVVTVEAECTAYVQGCDQPNNLEMPNPPAPPGAFPPGCPCDPSQGSSNGSGSNGSNGSGSNGSGGSNGSQGSNPSQGSNGSNPPPNLRHCWIKWKKFRNCNTSVWEGPFEEERFCFADSNTPGDYWRYRETLEFNNGVTKCVFWTWRMEPDACEDGNPCTQIGFVTPPTDNPDMSAISHQCPCPPPEGSSGSGSGSNGSNTGSTPGGGSDEGPPPMFANFDPDTVEVKPIVGLPGFTALKGYTPHKRTPVEQEKPAPKALATQQAKVAALRTRQERIRQLRSGMTNPPPKPRSKPCNCGK